MFSISMFEDTLGAEHLLIVLAIKLDLLALVNFTVLYAVVLLLSIVSTIGSWDAHRKSRQDSIVDWQVFCYDVMGNLVKGTLDEGVLVELT